MTAPSENSSRGALFLLKLDITAEKYYNIGNHYIKD